LPGDPARAFAAAAVPFFRPLLSASAKPRVIMGAMPLLMARGSSCCVKDSSMLAGGGGGCGTRLWLQSEPPYSMKHSQRPSQQRP
jgi:hypothetical protein